MSAATARATRPARPTTRPSTRPTARSAAYLRLVATRRSSAARAPFIAVVVVILAAGLLGLLLLNTMLAQDAFRLHALQVQSRVLADQEQSLQRDVERLQSPQSLASRAAALGMVPGGTRAFLELPSGKVRGIALPGQAPPPPVVHTAATTATPAKPKPSAASNGGWVPVTTQPAPQNKPAQSTSAQSKKPAPKPTRKP